MYSKLFLAGRINLFTFKLSWSTSIFIRAHDSFLTFSSLAELIFSFTPGQHTYYISFTREVWVYFISLSMFPTEHLLTPVLRANNTQLTCTLTLLLLEGKWTEWSENNFDYFQFKNKNSVFIYSEVSVPKIFKDLTLGNKKTNI